MNDTFTPNRRSDVGHRTVQFVAGSPNPYANRDQPPLDGDGRTRLSAGAIAIAIAILVGLGLLIVFMVQNTERVAVSFLLWNLDSPVWFMVLGAALLGAIVLYGLGVVRRRRQGNE